MDIMSRFIRSPSAGLLLSVISRIGQEDSDYEKAMLIEEVITARTTFEDTK